MRVGTAATLFVVVVVVSSVSFAVPVGSSSQQLVRGPPNDALADAIRSSPDPPEESSDPDPLSGFGAVHEAGVTGDGVRVGVIGSQFSPGGRLGESVVATRTFADRSPGLAVDSTHDTAVAEIVARTAPDSELYLASIGLEGGPAAYERAVSWLRENEVDVVVDAGSYFPRTAEGMARLNEAAAAAAENDTAFVTSAGNYAERHWAGTGNEGWLAFANDTRYNTLGEGEIAGGVSLRLYWEGNADYDLFLYRAENGEDPLIAKSATNETGNGSHTEAIDATVPEGRYYVAVQGGPDAGESTVDLFSSRHELGISSDGGGMVAPATAEGVIAVGAVDAVTGEPRSYSSTGPRLDISAPGAVDTNTAGEMYGSSVAAPLVAGALTLMLAENESLSPAEAQRVFRNTAVQDDGRLYLDAAGAVTAVTSESPAEIDGDELDWYNGTAD
ncbi:S8 family serine peptidase [Halolamina sp. C58]|uniref:S8 family serine peptidase n=1 Tax=Halolamina sp. C58 TaxID=3421640 RepID=UPI003EBC07D1